jgi:hypothetical protein
MLVAALACAAGLAAAPARRASAEDLTLVYKTTGTQGASTATSYYSTEKMRTTDGQNDTIIEYGPGKIVTIDHKKKEYSEITLAEMEAMLKQASAKMEEMSKQLANMPPEMKKKMEQMMGGGVESVSVTKGGSRQVAGYTCQDYTLSMGQAMTQQLCATTALQFPAPNVDYKRFSGLASSAGAMSSMFPGFAKLADEMKKIEGISIAEATHLKMMGRNIDTTREATEIKKGAIPASAFDVAAIAPGYKKVAHPVTKMK